MRAATDIPIAAGESEFTRHDFRDLAVLGAVDIMQPDLAICGGITEAMRISAIASAHNLKLAPHLWAGAPAFAAGLHVAAASPAGFIVEYSLGANPLLHDLVEEEFPVTAGMIEVPDRPGLGITVREDFLAEARGGAMKALFLGNVAADTGERHQGRAAGRSSKSRSSPIRSDRAIARGAADDRHPGQQPSGAPITRRRRAISWCSRSRPASSCSTSRRCRAACAVCNAFGHETAIAEYIVMVMLALHHRFREIAGEFRERGSWRIELGQSGAPHGEVRGSTLGIVGYGRVGREVARRAGAVRLPHPRRQPHPARAGAPGSSASIRSAELDRMLPECDTVAMCTALGPGDRRG